MSRPGAPEVSRTGLGAGQTELVGIALDAVTTHATIEAVLAGLEDRRGGWICPVNLDVLRRLTVSPSLRELVAAADLVVADGMPLLWANRLAGATRLPERVAGSTLVGTLAEACAAAGRSVFLLGGSPGAAERAARELRRAHPALRVAGTHCPPFGFERDSDALSEIERRLREPAPDVVFVALGFPKQDRLALSLRATCPSSWFLSCGISLSFLAGDVSRAPRLAQLAGLEWLHRLAQEPRRLARRYLLEGPPFLLRLLGWAAWRRVRWSIAGDRRREPPLPGS